MGCKGFHRSHGLILSALKFYCHSLFSFGKLRYLYRPFNCTFPLPHALSLQKRKDALHRREELLQLFPFKNKRKKLIQAAKGTIHSLLLLEIQEVVKQLNSPKYLYEAGNFILG